MKNRRTSFYHVLGTALLCTSIAIDPLQAGNPFVKPSSALSSSKSSTRNLLSDINASIDTQGLDVTPDMPVDPQPAAAPQKKKKNPNVISNEASVEFNFEDADLQNLVTQISDIFGYTFITDDMVESGGQPQQGAQAKPIKGNKISFKTEKPLTKTQAWNLFITFLDLAGLNIVPLAEPGFYKIVETVSAIKRPVPTFIGTDFEKLPDSDQMVRYVYFVENSTPQDLKPVIDQLKGRTADAILLLDQKAIILTDKSYNVKGLMRIIKELDKVTIPQSMSILKLRRADAAEVKKLYDELTNKGKDAAARNRMLARKTSAQFFPESIEIIAEPRTNALILFGAREEVKKVEDFIINHVDVDLDQPYTPFHIYQVLYSKATAIADIMNQLNKFGGDTAAGKSGGVRGEDKYMRAMNFTAEEQTNRIIIQGDEDDFQRAKKIIEELDSPQPQVAIEVLIVSVQLNSGKNLGAQLRNKVPGPNSLLGNNVNFQTSGINFGGGPNAIVENTNTGATGAQRLLGNLVSLINGSPVSPLLAANAGNTVLTLGQDAYGVWGIFNALQTLTNAQVVSNPFLVATNNTPASVRVGEIRRIITGVVQGTQSTNAMGDSEAFLEVLVTPQINSDGMIVMKNLTVDITNFTSPVQTDPTKTERKIVTNAIVANKEVLALGGLIRSTSNKNLSKTPLLGNIPVIGWLFKNRADTDQQESLLILLSANIIEPMAKAEMAAVTDKRIAEYHENLAVINDASERRDPVNRWFFRSQATANEKIVDDFLFNRKEARITEGRKKGKEKRTSKYEQKAFGTRASGEHQKVAATTQPPEKQKRRVNKKAAAKVSTIDTSLMTKAQTTVSGAREISL